MRKNRQLEIKAFKNSFERLIDTSSAKRFNQDARKAYKGDLEAIERLKKHINKMIKHATSILLETDKIKKSVESKPAQCKDLEDHFTITTCFNKNCHEAGKCPNQLKLTI